MTDEHLSDRALPDGDGAAADSGRVAGRIVFDHGLPAAGIAVRAYSRCFGGEDILLASGETHPDGTYSLTYPLPAAPINLEIRTVGPGKQEVALSEPKFGANESETLDVVAPASVGTLAPEYDRLVSDVERTLGSASQLANAKEGEGRRDLTIVAKATGWDARLLALAATAAKVAAETGVPADALYGLYRAGLPTAPEKLFRTNPKLVDKALRRAASAGIIKRSNGDISTARKLFEDQARTALRDARAPGAPSSFGDLAAAARLPANERTAWEDAVLARASGPDLWETARKKGVSAASVKKLQLQGKLASLTTNNARLGAALQTEIKEPASLPALVDQGLYRAEAWKERVCALADDDEQLEQLIPPAYGGEHTADRLDAYAADMARKVRLAFPTHVVGHMLEHGDLSLDGGKQVGALLRSAAAEGFELGRTPVDAFFAAKGKTLLGPKGSASSDPRVELVRSITRIFQITPGNSEMKALLDAGFRSAQDVVAVDHDTFVTRYGGSLGPNTALVYRRAEQAVSVSQAMVASGRVLDSPSMYAISGDEKRRLAMANAAKAELIKHYPTMEQLFGSLDFCECEHCRSVLSPAAYLVDLLRFLDPQKSWDDFVTEWNASHPEQFGTGGDYDKPYDQLVQRRGDIANLPLTCENTNTLLPYIDVVNEILEYYVANQSYAGHDTGDSTSHELLAEPQHVLPQAYTTLDNARYPLELPFDLWLETVRVYLHRLGVPLPELLETFRPTDELFRAPNDPSEYFRAQIFAESLGLSPAEWDLFTNSTAWWQLYGYTSGPQADAELVSAKTLARRLGVSYRQLTDLVRTSFVNPGVTELGLLAKLGIGLDEVYGFEAGGMTDPQRATFTQVLNDFKARTKFDAKKWLDDRFADGTFHRTLVLAAPTIECNFDETRFQYADGKPAAGLDFLKLNLFVRLWKKLGWTIDELDHALTAFIPTNSLPLTMGNLGKALGTALLYLAHLDTLVTALPIDEALTKLPTLWTDIPTTGRNSLYARLFLTRTVLKDDPVFDEPTGKFLSDTRPRLVDHRGAVQAALALSASDLDRVAAAAGISLPSTVPTGPTPARARLSLSNLSALYRYRLLAGALGLSIKELITLRSLSGIDPFPRLDRAPLDPSPPAPALPSLLVDDHPFSQTIRFVDVARLVAASGFTIDELDYLLRHHFDPAGPYREDRAALLALVFDLGEGIARVQAEHTPPEDPAALDDETLRQELALVLPGEVVEAFMGMWRGTIQYEAVARNIAPADALDPDASPFDPSAQPYASEATPTYDPARQLQRLTFTGVLMPERRDDIAPNPGLFRSLLDDVQAQARAFSKAHLAELFPETAHDDFKDVEDAFEPVPHAPADARTVLARKRRTIVGRLYPLVRQRLIRELVVAAHVGTPGTASTLVEAVLTDEALAADPTHATAPLLDGFARAAEAGVTATFYASNDGTGAPLSTKDVGEVDTTAKPGTAHSARLEGVFEVPTSGSYRFSVHIDDAATLTNLRLSHLTDPVVATTSAAADYEVSVDVELKARVPYGLTLDVQWLATANPTGDVRVLAEGPSVPRGPLSQFQLHPAATVERVRRADLLLTKALRLITAFGLDERELRYLVAHPSDFGSVSLSSLPTSELPAASVAGRFAWFLRLAQYAALKRDLGLVGDDLIDIFENARHPYDPATDPVAAEAALLTDLHTRVAELLRRERAEVEATAKVLQFQAQANAATRVVGADDFAQEQGLRRLWDALRALQRLGVTADAVKQWTRIIDPNATTGRDGIARDLRNSLKAQFGDDVWPQIVQPISDELRRRKRDALVGYVLADPQHDFQRPDELYEYFLVDPATEPIVQTSRLQLAISSVQLFVQRCLLNLEPRVPAAAIGMGDAKSWDWMKRYRMWEANRKIFLYPENWLEPEFRDDKTHLYAALEGSLLQGEISNESAEDALVAYLTGLEAIARLQIVSTYVEEHASDQGWTIHVIGRTPSTPHAYYYRRHAYGVWSPWEPVDVDIEGDHVVAAMWRDRLHLFWLTFQAADEPRVANLTASTTAAESVDEVVRRKVKVRLHWSEYVRGKWTGLASGKTSTVVERDVPAGFDSSRVFVYTATEPNADGSDAILVCMVAGWDVVTGSNFWDTVEGEDWVHEQAAFRLATKNGLPTVRIGDTEVPPRPVHPYVGLNTHFEATARQAQYDPLFVAMGWPEEMLSGAPFPLSSRVPYEVVSADHDVSQSTLVPFFYQDEHHTFFVEPGVREPFFVDRDGWAFPRDSQFELPETLVLEAAVPELHVEPRPPEPFATYTVAKRSDWVTHPDNVIRFDDVSIGRNGVVKVDAPSVG